MLPCRASMVGQAKTMENFLFFHVWSFEQTNYPLCIIECQSVRKASIPKKPYVSCLSPPFSLTANWTDTFRWYSTDCNYISSSDICFPGNAWKRPRAQRMLSKKWNPFRKLDHFSQIAESLFLPCFSSNKLTRLLEHTCVIWNSWWNHRTINSKRYRITVIHKWRRRPAEFEKNARHQLCSNYRSKKDWSWGLFSHTLLNLGKLQL